MDEQDENRLEQMMKVLMKDTITLKEMEKMRHHGRSEQFIQNWLRQIAKLNLK
ncbi:MAG: hypothetical protein LKF74_01885 [Megasphaera sp.]|jgi:hypothetical protein|nr:hypothetical protein [Megasphaera sp.]MCH4188234.1 hypothetical protein [Megasphaera sp.]MCH4217294.1 hypothetical protein [Megasphaera sp.]